MWIMLLLFVIFTVFGIVSIYKQHQTTTYKQIEHRSNEAEEDIVVLLNDFIDDPGENEDLGKADDFYD